MNVQSLPSMTIDRFFHWSAAQDRRYELVEGVPRMLPYVTHNHSTIVMNLSGHLWRGLDPSRYHVGCADFAVETSSGNLRFPDVVVFRADVDGKARTVADPVVLAEVLSDSTKHIDFGDKKQEYLLLESLRAYIVLEQNQPLIWIWKRTAEGEWPVNPTILEGGEAELRLVDFDQVILLSAIYAGVN